MTKNKSDVGLLVMIHGISKQDWLSASLSRYILDQVYLPREVLSSAEGIPVEHLTSKAKCQRNC